MDQATKEFWEQYKSAPGVLAVMPARIIGKSSSVHPGEPVSVTLEATLPDGRSIGMQLILSDPEAAAKIPDTIEFVTDPSTGQQTRKHLDPTDVYLVLMHKPKDKAAVEHIADADDASDLSGVEKDAVAFLQHRGYSDITTPEQAQKFYENLEDKLKPGFRADMSEWLATRGTIAVDPSLPAQTETASSSPSDGGEANTNAASQMEGSSTPASGPAPEGEDPSSSSTSTKPNGSTGSNDASLNTTA